MEMTGQFRFALIPGADAQAFLDLMRKEVFHTLPSTRITRGFDHALLEGPAPGQYVWQARVDLMTDHGYHFSESAAGVQDLVKDYAVLTGIDVFKNLG
jgi:hypothetical protein